MQWTLCIHRVLEPQGVQISVLLQLIICTVVSDGLSDHSGLKFCSKNNLKRDKYFFKDIEENKYPSLFITQTV